MLKYVRGAVLVLESIDYSYNSDKLTILHTKVMIFCNLFINLIEKAALCFTIIARKFIIGFCVRSVTVSYLAKYWLYIGLECITQNPWPG